MSPTSPAVFWWPGRNILPRFIPVPPPRRSALPVRVMVRRTRDQVRLDRRLAPRPLAAHLASAMVLWSSSRTVLPILKDALLLSNEAGERLRGLAAEIDAVGSSSVAAPLDLGITRRAQSYLAGLEAYRRHPYRRSNEAPPVLWRKGTTRLLDYGGDTAGPVILVVPSLINRLYVLDLLPERSFLRYLDRKS